MGNHSVIPRCFVDDRFSYTFRSGEQDQKLRVHRDGRLRADPLHLSRREPRGFDNLGGDEHVRAYNGSSAQTVFPPCTAPGGVPGSLSDFADSLEIITFKKTGDVLLQNLVSGTECAASSILTGAPPPAPFEGTLTVTNVGGTGKFDGATGTVTLNFAGQYLSCGNNGCVGFVQHREKGSITTP